MYFVHKMYDNIKKYKKYKINFLFCVNLSTIKISLLTYLLTENIFR